MTTSHNNIFAILMKERYHDLPQTIQEFHNTPCILWEGEAKSGGSTNFLAKLMRKIMGFPEPMAKLPVTVNVSYTEQGRECWTRRFGNKQFSSYLSLDKTSQMLIEQFGPVKQYFTLELSNNWLYWRLMHCTMLGIKLPKLLQPQVIANEGVTDDDTYQFVAKVSLPIIGTLVEYSGFLNKLK